MKVNVLSLSYLLLYMDGRILSFSIGFSDILNLNGSTSMLLGTLEVIGLGESGL